MKTPLSDRQLAPHPRLYLGEAERRRLKGPFRLPLLRAAAAEVARLADECLAGPQFAWVRNTHNAHLLRARRMQCRVVALLAQWTRTDDARYRDAARDHLLEMGRWECWSWIAWRNNQLAPDAIFDLSYGENSATLAIGYDWLYDTLDDAERQAILAVMRRPVAAFLKHTAPESRVWWFGKRDSNWNTVCAGGAGMLALACDGELHEAALIRARACESIDPFVEEIRTVHGAWPEGIGYWNYGMRYLYMFVLSLERATGRRSPWLEGREVRDALAFPMRFAPYPGCACSFGDVNQWSPLPFHLAAARRLRQPAVLSGLKRRLQPPRAATDTWPNAAELLCLHDAAPSAPPPRTAPFLHHYKGLDWVVLADRMPAPRLYASVRGGTTEVPHGHVDLTSFHAVVGGEKMIDSLGPAQYLDTTFSARRWELFEMIPMSKNVLLADGVGITRPATVTTRTLRTPWGPAVRLDAAAALGGGGRRDNDGVLRYFRLFLLLPGTGLLVLDTVKRPHASLFEQRFFTPVRATPQANGFLLQGERQTATLACACIEEAVLHTAAAPLTQPSGAPPTMLRQVTKLLHEEILMAALLTPGARAVPLALRRGARGGIDVAIGAGGRRVLRLGRDLLPR